MMNLTNMRIGKRLAVGFGIAIVLAIGIAGTGWWSGQSINAAGDKALDEGSKLLLTHKTMLNVSTIEELVLKATTAPDKNHADQYQAQLTETRQAVRTQLAEIQDRAASETSKQLARDLTAAFAAQRETNYRALDLAAAGKRDEALQLLHGEAGARMVATSSIADQLAKWEENKRTAVVEEKAAIAAKARWILGILSLLSVAISVGFAIFITRSISKPLDEGTAFLEQVSKGDLSKDVTAEMLARKDEVGDLGRSVQTMAEHLRKLLREISQGIQTVASSSTQLTAASSQTASSVKSMSEKSSTVAAAAEESCATTTAVSSSMERASANLTSVAGATEEMSSTVAEIASNSEKARVISEKAMAQAQTISTIMSELGRAAQEIGKVTETITDISAQTNLLALNATIEAARAGTAGKGFAVVANEIKELAKQTSEATEDIKAKIAGVQNSTTGAVQSIETITGVIKEIGNTVASTAAAIEEQATVTKNVAGEIAQATAVVREVNDQVAQTATVSRSIASDIATVNSATAGIREGGQQVETSASELSRLSEQLKVLVAQFSV
jgi:methyl-accepting chemotaxis protein